MTIASRIHELRERAGMSARDLSIRAGLSAGTVHDIERHPEKSPRVDTVKRIADTLGVSPSYLIEGRIDNMTGLSEGDAAPWTPPAPSGQRPDLAELQRRIGDVLAPAARHAANYSIAKTMPGFALVSGDVAVIDLKANATQGDLVIATVADLQSGTAQTVVRRYLPPYLISADDASGADTLVVDNHRTSVMGPVVAVFRAPQLTG